MLQIDRLYEWKQSPHSEVQNTLKKQKQHTKDEFHERTKAVITEFAEQVCPSEKILSHRSVNCGRARVLCDFEFKS